MKILLACLISGVIIGAFVPNFSVILLLSAIAGVGITLFSLAFR